MDLDANREDRKTAISELLAARKTATAELLAAIKDAHSDLSTLLEKVTGDWVEGDLVYRFYHQSFKVFWLQSATEEIASALTALIPAGCELDSWFCQIIAEGTNKTFEIDDNERWLEVTRPILEAYFHARYMLEAAVKAGDELDDPPQILPSSWAALLCLYGLR